MYAPPTMLHTDKISNKIFEEINQYCTYIGVPKLLPIKRLKLFNDHMVIINSLGYQWPVKVLKDLRRRFITNFQYQIPNEDCEAILSEIPSIVLQCKWVDSKTLMYRLNIMNGVRIEKWRSTSSIRSKWQVSEYVFNRLVELSDYKYLKEETYE